MHCHRNSVAGEVAAGVIGEAHRTGAGILVEGVDRVIAADGDVVVPHKGVVRDRPRQQLRGRVVGKLRGVSNLLTIRYKVPI